MGILIDGWLRDQRVGFAANAVQALESSDPSNPAIANLARCISAELHEIDQLSLATTTQLARVSDESWAALLGEDSLVIAKLAGYRRASKSRMLARKTFVGHALTVIVQPHIGLRDFVKWARRTGIKDSGSTDAYWKQRLEALQSNDGDRRLDEFRSATFIDDRLRAIDDLHWAGFGKDTNGLKVNDEGLWSWLCQALVSQQFCWPLLSAEIGEATFGVSLPLQLMLTRPLEGRSPSTVHCRCRDKTYMRPTRLEDGGWTRHRFTSGPINWTNDFQHSLATGLIAGKALWASQNGRAARAMRLDHLDQNLTVDFTWAHGVVDGLPLPDVTLSGRSAELYVTQIVLARLLGFDTPIGVATGTIDTNSPTLPVGFVDDVDLKARYARDAGVFSRLILPAALSPSFEAETRPALDELHATGRLEVNYCPTARSAADAMQRAGWRRTTFLDAPEERFFFYDTLGRLFNAAKECGAPEKDFDLDSETETVSVSASPMAASEIEALQRRASRWLENSQGVVKVRASASDLRPQLVGPTIAWLDHSTRVDPLNTTGPGLGIVFARLHGGDNEVRFWSRLLKSMNVSSGVWLNFQWATVEQAQALLALVLNNFNVDPRISNTPPPDLLVIVDDADVSVNRSNEIFPEDFRGQLYDVFSGQGLTSKLEQRDVARSRALGKTRVIILQPDCVSGGNEEFDDPAPEALQPLRVFRSGFTVQLAAAAWAHASTSDLPTNIAESRIQLDELMKLGWLGRHRAEYYVRWNRRQQQTSHDVPASLHLAVAKAWAPILDSSARAFLNNRDSVFEARALEEAIWHLQTAIRGTVPRMRQLQVELRSSLLSLLSLLPDADWDLVRPLMNSGQKGRVEALELAEELLMLEDTIRRGSGNIHSSRYALAIHVAARRIQDEGCSQAECENLIGRALAWYENGRSSIDGTGPQQIKLTSEFAFFLRSWEALPGQSRHPLLKQTESLIDERLKGWWPNRHQADSWLDVPLSMDWMRRRISDNRPEDARSIDARIAAELWLHKWPEPWLLLLGLMAPDRFTVAQVGGVFNLLGNAPKMRIERASLLGRAIRLRTYAAPERRKVTEALSNVLTWLFVVSPPLEGHRAAAATELLIEWITESHNCFDLMQHIPNETLVGVLLNGCQNVHFRRLCHIVFADSWGCWAMLSRLPVNLASRDARKLTIRMASGSPRPRFDAGLAIGDTVAGGDREQFLENQIPPRFFTARIAALQWLRNLWVDGRDVEYGEARAHLLRQLYPFYRPELGALA